MRLSEIARRRVDGTFLVDEWGFDADLARLAGAFVPLRWTVHAFGFEYLPEAGSALMVIGPRAKLSEPVVVAAATRRETGRHLRVAGADRYAPTRGFARRMGAVPGDHHEVRGVLRTGAVVGVLCARHAPGAPEPGPVDPSLVSVALELEVPVIPVAVRGHELGRRWTVTVGAPLADPGVGPLAAVDVSERAADAIGDLLG